MRYFYCLGRRDLLQIVKTSLGHWVQDERFRRGTEYKRSKNSIKMNQTRYIQKILSRFKMSDCKPKPTPRILGIEKVSNIKSPKLSDPII